MSAQLCLISLTIICRWGCDLSAELWYCQLGCCLSAWVSAVVCQRAAICQLISTAMCQSTLSARLPTVKSAINSAATCQPGCQQHSITPTYFVISVFLFVLCPLVRLHVGSTAFLSAWHWCIVLAAICQLGCDVSAQLSYVSSGANFQPFCIISTLLPTQCGSSLQAPPPFRNFSPSATPS